MEDIEQFLAINTHIIRNFDREVSVVGEDSVLYRAFPVEAIAR